MEKRFEHWNRPTKSSLFLHVNGQPQVAIIKISIEKPHIPPPTLNKRRGNSISLQIKLCQFHYKYYIIWSTLKRYEMKKKNSWLVDLGREFWNIVDPHINMSINFPDVPSFFLNSTKKLIIQPANSMFDQILYN